MTMLQSLFFIFSAAAVDWMKYNSDPSVFYFFLVSQGILTFFTVFITQLKKNKHKSADELMARTLTFWWMISLVGLSLLMPPVVLMALLFLGGFLALAEAISFRNKKSNLIDIISSADFWGLLPLLIINSYLIYKGNLTGLLASTLLGLGIYWPSFNVFRNNIEDSKALAWNSLSFFFAGVLWPSSFLLAKVNIELFLMVAFLTEIRDLVSYWLGKLFSKRFSRPGFLHNLVHEKVASQVSPNKTWFVGFLSGVLISLMSLGMGKFIFSTIHLSEWQLVLVGTMISIVGLLGDLVFSLLKRIEGIKDSGTWMPGGSGILDRIDALILTMPLCYFLTTFF